MYRVGDSQVVQFARNGRGIHDNNNNPIISRWYTSYALATRGIEFKNSALCTFLTLVFLLLF